MQKELNSILKILSEIWVSLLLRCSGTGSSGGGISSRSLELIPISKYQGFFLYPNILSASLNKLNNNSYSRF